MITRRLPISTLFPYTTLFRSKIIADVRRNRDAALFAYAKKFDHTDLRRTGVWITQKEIRVAQKDRKSTRLNSSHTVISYAVFCLKKKMILRRKWGLTTKRSTS